MRLILILSSLFLAASCSSSTPLRDPAGELFPAVSGESLEGQAMTLPVDLGAKPAILLAGYEMETQFDIDRWILGLTQAGTPVQLLEIPTIPGMFPGLYSGFIDDGMRKGIPEEDWGVVVTVYGGDASKIAELTGTEKGRNARVFLLDEAGRIAWFTDRGYSASQLLELDALARELDIVTAMRAAEKELARQ